MDASARLIQATKIAIHNLRNEDLPKLLAIMPIDQLDADSSEILFHELLETSAEANNTKAVSIIFDVWQRSYPQQNNIPITTWVFTSLLFTVDELRFIAESLGTLSSEEIISNLATQDSSVKNVRACKKAIDVFGEENLIFYQQLFDIAMDNENYAIADFLNEGIRRVAQTAEVPEWIINMYSDKTSISSSGEASSSAAINVVPKASELPIPEFKPPSFIIPTDNVLIDLLMEGLEDTGITPDDANESRRVLAIKLAVSTPQEKLELARSVAEVRQAESLGNNEQLFRLFGPANPEPNSTLNELKWGGHRMFLSTTFDNNFEFGRIDDWFTGSCWECSLKIRNRFYCVRIPNPTGGWEGSYCSWKCVRDAIAREPYPNLASQLLVDLFEKQIKEIGIQDRIDDVTFEDLLELEGRDPDENNL